MCKHDITIYSMGSWSFPNLEIELSVEHAIKVRFTEFLRDEQSTYDTTHIYVQSFYWYANVRNFGAMVSTYKHSVLFPNREIAAGNNCLWCN